MSDHDWLQGYSQGWDEGREQGRDDMRVILADLIAELVGMADQGLDSGWAPLYEVADRAEARLLDDSPEVSPAATVQDDEKLSDAACGLCNTQWSVTCVDCERTFRMRASEERAFYRFHKCSPPERAILQDLINEASVAWGSDPDSVADALDRAEARLREVTE